MTAVLIATHAAVLLVGLVLGGVRVRRSKSRWLLAGQRQAEATHSDWHPVLSEGWNRTEPKRRRRSPDEQFLPEQSRSIDRSVMHRHP